MADAVLEEKVAHLMRAVDDLSDVVASHAKEIERLTRLVTLLVEPLLLVVDETDCAQFLTSVTVMLAAPVCGSDSLLYAK